MVSIHGRTEASKARRRLRCTRRRASCGRIHRKISEKCVG
jgi:hypothetical protein